MTENNDIQEEIIDDIPQDSPEEIVSEPVEQDNSKSPPEKVEFSTPEQEKRFKDVWKQVKMSDARNQMLTDALTRQQEVLEELQSRFNQTDHAEAEKILNQRYREAQDNGDDEKANKILNEIIEFKAEAKIKQLIPKEKPKAEPLPYSDDDVKSLVSFAQETDDRGQPLRPWINATHSKHAEAMKYAGIYAMEVNAEYGYVDIPETMKRVEKAMSQQKRPVSNNRSPDPMKSSLTNNNSRAKVSLSSKESEILSKLNAHLSTEKQIKPEGYMKWKN